MTKYSTTASYVAVSGADLYAEHTVSTGSTTDVAVLLLSEAEAASTRWSASLVAKLVDTGAAVIRFDTRDIGRSSWVDEPYGVHDLVNDAVSVLDHFGVRVAHVVGRSMGGIVAQHLALDEPERVSTLSLVSTTAGRREEFGLPEQWLIDRMTQRLFDGPPDGEDARVAWIVEQLEWFSGPVFEFDRTTAAEMVLPEVRDFWRGSNSHGFAVVDAPDRFDELVTISVPTMVVHGTVDPVYPLLHGQALAGQIPDASLFLIEGLGHEFPEQFVQQFVALFTELGSIE